MNELDTWNAVTYRSKGLYSIKVKATDLEIGVKIFKNISLQNALMNIIDAWADVRSGPKIIQYKYQPSSMTLTLRLRT